MKLTDLFEMPATQVDDAEREIARLFATLGIKVKFSSHFEDRITDGGTDEKGRRRGDLISKEDLVSAFERLRAKHDALKPEGRLQELHGVITDIFTKLNVPFGLRFDRHRGKYVLTLITALKKDAPFHTKPDDVIITV